jgi:hypothetical protein
MFVLVGGTITLLITTIVLTGLMYGYFAASECKLNQFFISFNLVLALIICLLSISPSVREIHSKSGLSQSSIVAVYGTYLIVSALVNEPIDESWAVCNPIGSAKAPQRLTVALGTVFTFIAIIYSTGSAATQGLRVLGNDEESEANLPLLSASEQGKEHLTTIEAAVESGALPASVLTAATTNAVEASRAGPSDIYPTEDEAEGVAYNYSFFHLIFVLASMYLAMLLTNWNTITIIPGQNESDDGMLAVIGKSWAAVWVKVVSSWLVMGLYAWTLLGPMIFPDREWS